MEDLPKTIKGIEQTKRQTIYKALKPYIINIYANLYIQMDLGKYCSYYTR